MAVSNFQTVFIHLAGVKNVIPSLFLPVTGILKCSLIKEKQNKNKTKTIKLLVLLFKNVRLFCITELHMGIDCEMKKSTCLIWHVTVNKQNCFQGESFSSLELPNKDMMFRNAD